MGLNACSCRLPFDTSFVKKKKTLRSTKPEVSAIFREDSDAMSTVGDKI